VKLPSRDQARRIAANFGKLRDFDVSGMTVLSGGTIEPPVELP